MSKKIERVQQRDIQYASSVVSLIMTGAFVLDVFNVTPVIPFTFDLLFSQQAPTYFNLALGAAGVFGVVYSFLYTVFFAPLKCMLDINIAPQSTVTLASIEASDFVTLILMFATYQWVIISSGYPTNGAVYLGGFFVIITSLLFQILPRITSKYVRPTCFYALKIVVVTVPLSALLFIPTMYIVIMLNGITGI